MAKAKAAPKTRETYSGYPAHDLAHSSPRKVPTAKAAEYATLKLPYNFNAAVAKATKWAADKGVDLGTLRFSSHYSLWVEARVPESDASFASRVAAAEKFNAALGDGMVEGVIILGLGR